MVKVPRVVAVVPIYFPDAMVSEHVASLSAQVDEVILVDDGTTGYARVTVDALAASGTRVVMHDRNRGIAAALNTGTSLALNEGADFVITFDQDTQIPLGYVAACFEVLSRAAAGAVPVGIVAAGSINGSAVLPHEFEAGIGLMRYAIQSGMMISADCLHACGLFDERLVIDAVDTEFCLRATSHGFAVAAALGTDLIHELGEQKPARLFGVRRMRDGVERTYEHHAPFRQYYISRNAIDLALRYLTSEPRWSLANLRSEIINFGVGFAAGPDRGRHLAAALLGTTHGLVRKRGTLSAGWRGRLATPRTVSDGSESQR